MNNFCCPNELWPNKMWPDGGEGSSATVPRWLTSPPMPRVQVFRSEFADSAHEVAACATDVEGAVLAELNPGDANRVVLLRSAAKPFQAAVSVEAGVLESLHLSDRHLAAACASHVRNPEQLQLVHEILASAGLAHRNLQCGDDGSGSAFLHMCSGNHALALATCVHMGWPTAEYLNPSHPLQLAYRATTEDAAGATAQIAPDGCGMTAFGFELRWIARSFAVLGAANEGSLKRCREAMQAHPQIVHGEGTIDTELMLSDPNVVAKYGAEAVLGIGRSAGLGAAARVLDGTQRALPPLGVAAAEMIGADTTSAWLSKLRSPELLDNRGEVVGALRLVD